MVEPPKGSLSVEPPKGSLIAYWVGPRRIISFLLCPSLSLREERRRSLSIRSLSCLVRAHTSPCETRTYIIIWFYFSTHPLSITAAQSLLY